MAFPFCKVTVHNWVSGGGGSLMEEGPSPRFDLEKLSKSRPINHKPLYLSAAPNSSLMW